MKTMAARRMDWVVACCLVSIASVSSTAQSYYFSTLAGTPSVGSSDGLADKARFKAPFGITADSAGNLYVADSGNHTIRKISRSGPVTTIAGLAGQPGSADGPAAAARFNAPAGITADVVGNLYIADAGNFTVRKISTNGIVSTVAGLAGVSGTSNGPAASARFMQPCGIAVDLFGNLYVSDFGDSTIRKIGPDGIVINWAGVSGQFSSEEGPAGHAMFNGPCGLAVTTNGVVFVADVGNFTIRQIQTNRNTSTYAGLAFFYGVTDGQGSSARFYSPYGIATDHAGNLFVADTENHSIRMITSGAFVTTIAGIPETSGYADGAGSVSKFNAPDGVTVDAAGNVFVADTGNNVIRKIASLNLVSTFAGFAASAGSSNGIGSDARFNSPSGIAVDRAGNAYVADTANHCIRRVDPNGAVSLFAGKTGSRGVSDGAAGIARFYKPFGAAVDVVGNVYVADSYNHAIRFIGTNGDVTTVAGQAGILGASDGTGTNAHFNLPIGIAVDKTGSIYVSDSGNQTIRLIATGGMVTTLAGSPGNRGTNDGNGALALFATPSGIAVDGVGNIYIADTGNHSIRKIAQNGEVVTLSGLPGHAGMANGALGVAQFNRPGGLAVDNAGIVYVADTGNHALRRVGIDGTATTIGGLPGFNGSADGIGSGAFFNAPSGIAAGPEGGLYVADTHNNTVRLGLPLPVLTIGLNGGQIALEWPASASSFVLEAAQSLTPPIPWAAITNGVSTTGIAYIFVPESAGLFFRLRKP
jgi:sugar lactone lactonase YvrE